MLPTVLIWRQHHTQSVPPAVLGIAVGIVSGVVFLPLAAKVVLGLIGFSAIGPVAGKPHSVTRLMSCGRAPRSHTPNMQAPQQL
jgi:hypothetical protein